jgi:hypothetical protein
MTDLPSPRKIRAVEARPGYRLAVAWDKGRSSIIDLSDMISRGGVFGALSDNSRFSAVRVGEGGRAIEWPDPTDDLGYPVIEIDSLALAYRLGTQENAVMRSLAKKFLEPIRRKSAKAVLPGAKT